MATAILHHVPNDLDVVFKELKRVIKDQGFLLIEEPGFLNPPAYFARKFLHSTMHDPNERPLIPKILKNKVSTYFSIKELKYYCIFSYVTPYIVPKLSEKSKPFGRKISSKIYNFDNMLLKSIFFQNFCGYIYILAQKL